MRLVKMLSELRVSDAFHPLELSGWLVLSSPSLLGVLPSRVAHLSKIAAISPTPRALERPLVRLSHWCAWICFSFPYF